MATKFHQVASCNGHKQTQTTVNFCFYSVTILHLTCYISFFLYMYNCYYTCYITLLSKFLFLGAENRYIIGNVDHRNTRYLRLLDTYCVSNMIQNVVVS